MNKHLIPVLILSGLLSACSKSSSSGADFSNISPECESRFRLYAVYLDKLEATGRFPPDKMACFRRVADMMVTAYHNRKSLNYTEEHVNKTCVDFERFTRGQIQKAEEIPNLSQEEFDADWGRIKCP
ncbi:MAG: hypothetical protein LBL48_01285 [Azoarcus sp.]|jgi:hypothetical protein|nr:hypothetical protein [Azoarcus sp.]